MKNILPSIFLFFCIFLLCSPLFSQKLTREDKKKYNQKGRELKKEFKGRFGKEPEKFEEFKQEAKTGQEDLEYLQKEVDKQKKLLNEKNQALDEQKKLNSQEEERLKQIKNGQSVKEQEAYKQFSKTNIPPKGVFFAVQSGDMDSRTLIETIYANESPFDYQAATQEIYTLGLYESEAKALELIKTLQAMGLKNVLIVRYEDGKPSEPSNGENKTVKKQ